MQTTSLAALTGGGDTVAVLNVASVKEHMTHVSTGGGAGLVSLEGKTLPGNKSTAGCRTVAATAG
jgi:phosphoglycerate kinase